MKGSSLKLSLGSLSLLTATQVISCKAEEIKNELPELFLDSQNIIFQQADLKNKGVELEDVTGQTDKFKTLIKTEFTSKITKPDKKLDDFVFATSSTEKKLDSNETKRGLIEFKIEDFKVKQSKNEYKLFVFDIKLELFKREKDSNSNEIWETTKFYKTIKINFYVFD